MRLNQRQRQVALAGRARPLKVIAGAGTGKTETLAARFVELVRGGVPASRIVLLTFTEDAAAEMRARLRLRLAEAELELAPHQQIDLWCHTFHGFAMRLLREWGWIAGLPPAPVVFDDHGKQALLQALVDDWEAEIGSGTYHPFEHASYAWESGEAWDKARYLLDRLRSSGAGAGDLAPHPGLADQQRSLFAAERAQLVPLVEHIYTAYRAHLRLTGALDYDEQIAAASRLLRAAPALQRQFDVVMVDEFQDTNPAQIKLLAELGPDWTNVTVVGDPRQAIYGWRSARPDSLRQFPPGAAEFPSDHPLQDNYRSRPAICDIANLALLHSDLSGEEPLIVGREPAASHPALLGAPEVSLLLAPSVADEARGIAGEIRQRVATGMRPSEIAILLRARTNLPVFTAALDAVGIPYIVGGGSGFFRQPAVRLVASLLHLLGDPQDAAAATHVLESPLVGLDLRLLLWSESDPAVITGRGAARWLADPANLPAELPDRERVAGRLHEYTDFFSSARTRSTLFGPGDFLEWLFAAGGLHQWYERTGDRQALRDLHKLVALADEWRRGDSSLTVAGYARRLRQSVLEELVEPVPLELAPDAVEIATVHGAKGREWPLVFVADTKLPSMRSGQVEHVLWDDEWKLVISDGRGAAKAAGKDPLADLRRDLRRRKRNEERAIWYVALTRARDRLVVTHSSCEVDEQGHFADAQAKLDLEAPSSGDDAVHFFHELWEHVRARRDSLAEAVFWGPGSCSGSEVPAPFAGAAPAPTAPPEPPGRLRDSWEWATRPGAGDQE